jgi:hypothetical protein
MPAFTRRRMRGAVFVGVALLLATAAGSAAADSADRGSTAAAEGGGGGGKKRGGDKKCDALQGDCDFLAGAGAKTCGRLEAGCDFVPAAALVQVIAAANFRLTTDGASAVTCVTNSQSDDTLPSLCLYDAASQTVRLVVTCPSGYLATSPYCIPQSDQGLDQLFSPQTSLNQFGVATVCALVSRFVFLLRVGQPRRRRPHAPGPDEQPARSHDHNQQKRQRQQQQQPLATPGPNESLGFTLSSQCFPKFDPPANGAAAKQSPFTAALLAAQEAAAAAAMKD